MEEPIFIEGLMILRRWHKLFGITVFVLALASLVMAALWSNFRSVATIEIKQQEISADTTIPAGVNPGDLPEALADLRVGQLQQKVLSQESLAAIITKYNLYTKARRSQPITAVADAMQKKIKLTLISGTVANPAAAGRLTPGQLSAIAFTLSFDYNDPQLAQQVAAELTARFLEEDLQDRHAKTQETSDFLGKQVAMLEAAMAEQEKSIAEFQRAHGGNTPESTQFYQQSFTSASQSIQNIDGQIVANEGMQGALRSQLASVDPYARIAGDGQVLTTPTMQMRTLQSQYTALTSHYGPEHPDVVKLRHQIEALHPQTGGAGIVPQLQAKVTDARSHLNSLITTYGSNHPDVIAAKRELSTLEDEIATQPARRATRSAYRGDADNPVYLDVVAQLRSAEVQHKALLSQRDGLVKERTQYQQVIAENPGLEQQMASLSRDYDNAKLRYRAIKEKKMVADMNQQLEMDSKGQRLVVINPAQEPMNTSPSRMLIMLGGCIIAFLGGVSSVFVAQTMTQCIIGARSLTNIIGIEPMVVIPHILTSDETTKSQNIRMRMNTAFMIALVITAIMVVYALLHPATTH